MAGFDPGDPPEEMGHTLLRMILVFMVGFYTLLMWPHDYTRCGETQQLREELLSEEYWLDTSKESARGSNITLFLYRKDQSAAVLVQEWKTETTPERACVIECEDPATCLDDWALGYKP